MANPVFQTDSDINISLGKVPGYAAAFGFGHNEDPDKGVAAAIWDFGKPYTYLPSATTLFASSSSASDTAVTITATGLAGDFEIIQSEVTLTGQTQVAFGTDFLRVFSVVNTSGTPLVGDVYIAESDTLTAGVPDTDSKVKSFIPVGKEITKNGFITTPADRSLLVHNIRFGAGKGESGTFQAKVRQEDGVFVIVTEIPVYQLFFEANITPPFVVPSKADIEFAFIPKNGGIPIGMNFDTYLIDESIPFSGVVPNLNMN